MLGLPKTTELSKPLPKKAIFEKFKPSAPVRKLFDEQISRLSITAEISPQTIPLPVGEEVTAIYLIHITLKTPECDKRNIALLSKLINQNILFILQYNEATHLAVCHAGKVFISEIKPFDEWQISLNGLDLTTVWANIIAQIGGIDLSKEEDIDTAITKHTLKKKLLKQIEALEKKAMIEKQPRKKWEIATKKKNLKIELEEQNLG